MTTYARWKSATEIMLRGMPTHTSFPTEVLFSEMQSWLYLTTDGQSGFTNLTNEEQNFLESASLSLTAPLTFEAWSSWCKSKQELHYTTIRLKTSYCPCHSCEELPQTCVHWQQDHYNCHQHLSKCWTNFHFHLQFVKGLRILGKNCIHPHLGTYSGA